MCMVLRARIWTRIYPERRGGRVTVTGDSRTRGSEFPTNVVYPRFEIAKRGDGVPHSRVN